MPLILAIEPDRRQASQLRSIVRRLRAELVLAESVERALAALDDWVPDLILTPALLSRRDDTALTDRLRELGGTAAHVPTLTIPILREPSQTPPRRGRMLSKLRGTKSRAATPDGCSPDVFADQITVYLERAAEAREAHTHILAPPTRSDTLAIPVIEFVAANVETPQSAVATAWEPLELRRAIGEPAPMVATPPPEPILQPPPLPVVESPHPPTAAMPDTLPEVPAVEPFPAVFEEPETVFEQPVAVVSELALLTAALRAVDDTPDVVVSSLDEAPVVMPAVELPSPVIESSLPPLTAASEPPVLFVVDERTEPVFEPPPVVFQEPGPLALVEEVENEPVADDVDSSDLAWLVAAERKLPDVAPAGIETLTVAPEPVPSTHVTQRFEGVLPTPIEEAPECVPEEIRVIAAELLPPIEADLPESIEPAIAMPLKEVPVAEIAGVGVKSAAPVMEIPAPVVETLALEEAPTVLADATRGLAARLRDVLLAWRPQRTRTSMLDLGNPAVVHEPVLPAPFPVVQEPALPAPFPEFAALADKIPELVPQEALVVAGELPQPSEATLSDDDEPGIAMPPETTPPAVFADEPSQLATPLDDALSALRHLYIPVSTVDERALAATFQPAASEPAPQPMRCEAIDDTPHAEPWVVVSLDAFAEVPPPLPASPDIPAAEDDIWVFSSVQEMEELLVAPAMQPAVPASSPAASAPEPEPESEPAPETPVLPAVTLPVAETPRVARAPKAPKLPKKKVGRPKRKKPAQDEWGFFDPGQCGFAALLDKLDEVTEDKAASKKREDTTVRLIAY